VGQEEIPQAALPGLRLELLHHLGVVVRISRVGDLLLVDGLGRIDPLFHERQQLLTEFLGPRAELEIHASPRFRSYVGLESGSDGSATGAG
jgi:hypothetical protein